MNLGQPLSKETVEDSSFFSTPYPFLLYNSLSQAGNNEGGPSEEEGVKYEATEGITRPHCFWLPALRVNQLGTGGKRKNAGLDAAKAESREPLLGLEMVQPKEVWGSKRCLQRQLKQSHSDVTQLFSHFYGRIKALHKKFSACEKAPKFESMVGTFRINWIKSYLSQPCSYGTAFQGPCFEKVGLDLILKCDFEVNKFPIKLSNLKKKEILIFC